MREQEKNNKGFSLLEIIVVLAIVGALAGVGIPNFTKWNNGRAVTNATEQVASLLRNIHATTERGTFAFVQVLFESDDNNGISIQTKGVTMDNFTYKMNDPNDIWNVSSDTRCSIMEIDPEFWTTQDADRPELQASIYNIQRSDVVFNFQGEASLCFSRNGKFFYADGEIGLDDQPENYLYILLKKEENLECEIDYVADPEERVIPSSNGDNGCKYVGAIKWTRFGEIDTFKWNETLQEWK